jgi:hypothetical protein
MSKAPSSRQKKRWDFTMSLPHLSQETPPTCLPRLLCRIKEASRAVHRPFLRPSLAAPGIMPLHWPCRRLGSLSSCITSLALQITQDRYPERFPEQRSAPAAEPTLIDGTLEWEVEEILEKCEKKDKTAPGGNRTTLAVRRRSEALQRPATAFRASCHCEELFTATQHFREY